VPQSALTDVQTTKSYLTNNPELMHNQAWVASLMKTVNRESQVVDKQYKNTAYRRVQNYEFLRNDNPAEFSRKLKAAGLNEDEFDAYMSNGGKLPEEPKQQDTAPATATSAAPAPQQEQGFFSKLFGGSQSAAQAPTSVQPIKPSIMNYRVK
jgi:Txe/YoeB family toxin of Txe-Axe toxin-antitoxin module